MRTEYSTAGLTEHRENIFPGMIISVLSVDTVGQAKAEAFALSVAQQKLFY